MLLELFAQLISLPKGGIQSAVFVNAGQVDDLQWES
jgi:hypothetical protein